MVPNKGKRCLHTKSNLCILFRVPYVKFEHLAEKPQSFGFVGPSVYYFFLENAHRLCCLRLEAVKQTSVLIRLA